MVFEKQWLEAKIPLTNHTKKLNRWDCVLHDFKTPDWHTRDDTIPAFDCCICRQWQLYHDTFVTFWKSTLLMLGKRWVLWQRILPCARWRLAGRLRTGRPCCRNDVKGFETLQKGQLNIFKQREHVMQDSFDCCFYMNVFREHLDMHMFVVNMCSDVQHFAE